MTSRATVAALTATMSARTETSSSLCTVSGALFLGKGNDGPPCEKAPFHFGPLPLCGCGRPYRFDPDEGGFTDLGSARESAAFPGSIAGEAGTGEASPSLPPGEHSPPGQYGGSFRRTSARDRAFAWRA